MNPYFVPPVAMYDGSGATALLTPAPVTAEQCSRALETRTSQRFFTSETLSPDAVAAITSELGTLQQTQEGIRFVCAVRTGPSTGHLSRIGPEGRLLDGVAVDDWNDLYLQGEYASAPLVVVAVLRLDGGWRTFEQRMIASTAALTSVWLAQLRGPSHLEGSVFAGVLGGWLRLHDLIAVGESPGVALALGVPISPSVASPTPESSTLASTPLATIPPTHINHQQQGATT